MSTHSQTHHHDRAKVTIECSVDERAYIKILAARAHMNLSEFILSYLKKDFPDFRAPNKVTIDSMKELDEGRGIHCSSLDDFWKKMGMSPDA